MRSIHPLSTPSRTMATLCGHFVEVFSEEESPATAGLLWRVSSCRHCFPQRLVLVVPFARSVPDLPFAAVASAATDCVTSVTPDALSVAVFPDSTRIIFSRLHCFVPGGVCCLDVRTLHPVSSTVQNNGHTLWLFVESIFEAVISSQSAAVKRTIFEPHQLLAPCQRNDPTRPRPIFCNDHFRNARLILSIVSVWTVQKQHHIGVLLNAP